MTQQDTAAEVLEAQAHETLSHMTLDRPRRDGVRTPSREKLRTNSAGDVLGDCPASDDGAEEVTASAASPGYGRSISHPADNQVGLSVERLAGLGRSGKGEEKKCSDDEEKNRK